jgi:hypothetical protein
MRDLGIDPLIGERARTGPKRLKRPDNPVIMATRDQSKSGAAICPMTLGRGTGRASGRRRAGGVLVVMKPCVMIATSAFGSLVGSHYAASLVESLLVLPQQGVSLY